MFGSNPLIGKDGVLSLSMDRLRTKLRGLGRAAGGQRQVLYFMCETLVRERVMVIGGSHNKAMIPCSSLQCYGGNDRAMNSPCDRGGQKRANLNTRINTRMQDARGRSEKNTQQRTVDFLRNWSWSKYGNALQGVHSETHLTAHR